MTTDYVASENLTDNYLQKDDRQEEALIRSVRCIHKRFAISKLEALLILR